MLKKKRKLIFEIEWINKFKVIMGFIVLPITILSFILTVIVFKREGKVFFNDIIYSTAFLCLLALSVAIYLVISQRVKTRPKILFLPNKNDMLPKYNIESTLKILSKGKHELTILGRTCLHWLCANEELYNAHITQEKNIQSKTEKDEYEKRKETRQRNIETAINNGSKIHFVLMNENNALTIDEFKKEEERSKLKSHMDEALKSYNEIAYKLNNEEKKRLKLSFTNEKIANSMSRLTKNGQIERFHYDISVEFFREKQNYSKPAIVFINSEDCKQYNEILETIVQASQPKEGFFKLREKTLSDIKEKIKEYTWHSKLRKNKSELFAKNFFKQFKYKKFPNLLEHDPPVNSPVSIQLLLTNQCTNKCKMCRHYNINTLDPDHKETDELSKDEINKIIHGIIEMGTKSIILSGGEPLYKKEFFEILQAIDNKEIKVGLLTNGIKYDDKPLTDNEAERIHNKCEWIQVSLDSLDKETYKQIRGENKLEIVIESLRALMKAFNKKCESQTLQDKLEVCFTIQKDNIEEVPSVYDKLEEFGLSQLNDCVRFKFVHGPETLKNQNIEDIGKFLCTEKQILSLNRRLTGKSHFEYLYNMIDKKHIFNIKDIVNGRPVDKNIDKFKELKYCCHALNFTCLIDPFGDVYPCCFLFDDNSDRNNIRSRYKIGSLRGNAGNVGDDVHERLSEIWRSKTLNAYRNIKLPIDPEACSYCTRHSYHNEFLNELNLVIDDNEERYKYLPLDNLEDEIYTDEKINEDVFWL